MDFSALSEEYKTMSVENDFIDQEYRMISQMRVGVEGLIPFSETFGLTARAGMAFIPSPQRSGTAEKQISIRARNTIPKKGHIGFCVYSFLSEKSLK